MFEYAEPLPNDMVRHCPVCGNTFPHLPASPNFDAPCSGCGGYLWCSQYRVGDVIVLEAMPDRTPALWDVEQVVESLFKHGAVRRIVFDLSHLTYISSALVARLVAMNRRVRAAGSEFVLCGMSPIVREAFDTFQLVKAFTVMETQQEALAK